MQPFPSFSPSLISLIVSEDVKHHAYLLCHKSLLCSLSISVCLSVHLSVCLSVSLSVCLSLFLVQVQLKTVPAVPCMPRCAYLVIGLFRLLPLTPHPPVPAPCMTDAESACLQHSAYQFHLPRQTNSLSLSLSLCVCTRVC